MTLRSLRGLGVSASASLAALAAGVVAGLLVARRRTAGPAAGRRRPRPPAKTKGGRAIDTDADQPTGKHGLKGLGRKSLDSLRVGVVVLDADDHPVLVNPAARAMGLLRSGGAPGTIAAHPILRTLAGQVRRTGVRREVELDLPRGRAGGPQAPLGLHLRAVALNSTHVAVEAADVTESHRLARVRRDFVANVSHELKTPIGALQLLAEALLDATEVPDRRGPAGRRAVRGPAGRPPVRRAHPPRVGPDGPAGQRAARADPAAGRRAAAHPGAGRRWTG